MRTIVQQSERGWPRWSVVVLNTTGETIPPYAVMRVVGAQPIDENEEYLVTKPSGSGSILFNSPSRIAPNERGFGTFTPPINAAYEVLDGTPVAGEEWGPHPLIPSWHLSRNGTGVVILGGAESGVVRVAPAKAASGSQNGDVPIIFIRNDSGLNRPSRTIFGIGDPITVPPAAFPSQPVYASLSPATIQPFAVSFGPVTAGGIIDAVTVGTVAVQVDVTDSTHTHAVVADNNYANLISASDGPARIIWRERGTILGDSTLGVQWAMVSLEERPVSFPVVSVVSEFGPIDAREISGFGTPLNLPPFQVPRKPAFNFKPPVAGEPFMVVFDKLSTGQRGDAAVSGLVACKVNILEAGHKLAGPITNTPDYLVSSTSGPAEIVWKEKQDLEGSQALGVQWCYVLLGGEGGDSATANVSHIAIMTVEAPPSSFGPGGISPGIGNPGKARLLDNNFDVDPSIEEIEVYALNTLRIKAGTLVELSSVDGITPGSVFPAGDPDPEADPPERRVWASFLRVIDELEARTDFAARKSLAVQDVLSPTADDIKWLGHECEDL